MRSPTPISSSRSTVPCSSTPARTRSSQYSRLRASITTDSMPCRCSKCESTSPAGPAPTIPTCVRIRSASDSSKNLDALRRECYHAASIWSSGSRAMLVSHKKLLVEWGHCDPAGIVFFPQYLAWFDDCTTALFLDAGMPIQTLFKQHEVIGFPIVDLRVRFILPSKFGDELIAESTVTEFGKSSFVVRHQILKASAVGVEGCAPRVWSAANPNDPTKMNPRPLPKEVIDLLSAATPAADTNRSK